MKAADGEKLGETKLRLRQEDHDKLEQQYRDFEDDRIPGHVIGVYLTIPALFGRNESNANREECAELFEQVLEMGIAEDEVPRRFFGQHELYFDTDNFAIGLREPLSDEPAYLFRGRDKVARKREEHRGDGLFFLLNLIRVPSPHLLIPKFIIIPRKRRKS